MLGFYCFRPSCIKFTIITTQICLFFSQQFIIVLGFIYSRNCYLRIRFREQKSHEDPKENNEIYSWIKIDPYSYQVKDFILAKILGKLLNWLNTMHFALSIKLRLKNRIKITFLNAVWNERQFIKTYTRGELSLRILFKKLNLHSKIRPQEYIW